MGESDGRIRVEDYCLVKDFRREIEVGEGGAFSFAFWLYLVSNNDGKEKNSAAATAFPVPIIKQVQLETAKIVPFVALNEKKKLVVFPLLLLHKEALSTSLTDLPMVAMETDFPFGKWVHVGCEVFMEALRLHVNGEFVGEQKLSSLFNIESNSNGSVKITLVGASVDDGLQGYFHNAEVMPSNLCAKEYDLEESPLKLCIDSSSTSEIEEESDRFWIIVGGKASCRRVFALDVVLVNANSKPVNKDLEVVASLLYVDNGLPVEKTSDDEAPLLTIYDGIEFPSSDRPSKLLNGRASFKLKISQLSSKCENRLFCIKFEMPRFKGYHFLEAVSYPIRCISRGRIPRTSSPTWNSTASTLYPLNWSHVHGLENGSSEFHHNSLHEIDPCPSPKRIKLRQEMAGSVEQPDKQCSSHALIANQVNNALGTVLEVVSEKLEAAVKSTSGSENTQERNSHLKAVTSCGDAISDAVIFKYCLGGLTDRAVLLKEVAASASEQQLSRFAHEVSFYSGCSHHSCQIMVAKRLIEEGTQVWNSITQKIHLVRWENAVFLIEKQFMKISCSSTRSLTEQLINFASGFDFQSSQDLKLLKRIAGCREYVAQENFEKMWCWLYPIAFSLSRGDINTLWNSTSPKWIEGFITKEEAELSLRGPRGLQEPGTFILRFPTSRSWPHPDAGSLIVTYVGHDNHIHHRMLSLDYMYRCDENEKYEKPLQDLLLAEPELSRLGRTLRSQ